MSLKTPDLGNVLFNLVLMRNVKLIDTFDFFFLKYGLKTEMYHFIIGFCENLYLNRHKFLYLFFETVIILHCPSRFYMVLIVCLS